MVEPPKGPLAPVPHESPRVAAEKAEAVAKELHRTPQKEKRRMSVDQKLLINEVQLLLADKRTAFALLRTGVTISLVPLSLWTFLIATSRLWNAFDVLWLLVPFVLVTGVIFLLGVYLIQHAIRHLRHTDAILTGLRQTDTLLEELMLQEPEHRWLIGRFYRQNPRRG